MGLNRCIPALQRGSDGIPIGLKLIAGVLDVAKPGREDLRACHTEAALAEEPFIFLRRADMSAPVHPAQEVV